MSLIFKSRGGRLRWLLVAACIPIIGLLIGGVLVAAREFNAGSRLHAKISELKKEGLPYDNASFDQWYRKRTHAEGAEAWVEVLGSVSATSILGEVNSLPIVGQGTELAELDPNAEWRDEARVKEYLTEMQGLLSKIHQLKQFPTPVQLPVEFQGVGTLLPHFQQARSVSQLLQLDFEYAFFHKDFERALQDLQSIGMVAQAIDNDLCLVVDLFAAAILNYQYYGIQRSLVTDTWPGEKLSALRENLSVVRHNATKWKNLFVCERALFGDVVASGDLSRLTGENHASLVPLLNTGRLRIFETYDELTEIGERDLGALKSASKLAIARLTKRDATFDVDGGSVWINLMLPAVEQMASAMENEENNRRLTLTAIAVRQFKRLEGRWPERLIELANVGLDSSDYCTVNRGTFGFEVNNEIAYLWGCDMNNDEPVSTTRPKNSPNSLNSNVRLITLR